jgi:branched-chain amino acid transport system substrate-binding protein
LQQLFFTRIRVVLALVFAGTLVAAPALAADAPEPIDFNVIVAQTGPGAFIGQAIQQSLELAAKQANAEGGIGGHPIRLVAQDNQSSPQLDIQLANGLIAKHVPFVIDSGPATVCHAAAPLYVNGPVFYCLSAAFYPSAGGYAFASNAPSKEGMATIVSYLRARGLTKIAMLSATDTPGQEADEILKTLLAAPENRALSMVAWEHFNPADISVNAQLTKIKAAQPQALLAWVTGAANGTVMRGIGDTGLNVPVFQSDANQFYAQMAAYKGIIPNDFNIYANAFSAYPNVGRGPERDVLAKTIATFKAAGLHLDLGAANSWDAMMILVSALRKLGPSATATQIRDYILNLHDFVGIDGVYDFRSGNQRGLAGTDFLVARWEPSADTWVAVSQQGGAPLRK